MDETWVLILLSLAMLAGCYISGLIPLIITFSEMPYDSEVETSPICWLLLELLCNSTRNHILWLYIDQLELEKCLQLHSEYLAMLEKSKMDLDQQDEEKEKLQLVSVFGAGLLVGTALAVIIPEGVHTLYSTQKASLLHDDHHMGTSKNGPEPTEPKNFHDNDHLELHNHIGMALVLGFIFMLVVDQIGGSHNNRNQDAEGGVNKDRSKSTATLGLVVHAAADGVALGAAASTSHTDVEMIVFIAIMLHKAPAAFGLVTFLMHIGLDRTRIRRHLLVFALAAPTLAIVTYFGISQKGKEALSTMNATGVAMLFSAGTFLYVATVHVLPEIALRSHSHGANGDNNEVKGFRRNEVFLLVLGAVLPLLLSVGHHH